MRQPNTVSNSVISRKSLVFTSVNQLFKGRVKSGKFGHQANSDSDLVCFIFYFLE